MMPSPRPHDLLQVDPARAELFGSAGAGALRHLHSAPYVVVRRAPRRSGRIPVGVRGTSREERYAAWLAPSAILAVVTPETLRAEAATRNLPAFAALRSLQQQWTSLAWPWGPTGSVGFELASGTPCVLQTSDLDLLLRAERRLTREELAAIASALDRLPCAVDLQIETPAGAFAFQEYLAGVNMLLLRTTRGPRLVRDPWQPEVFAAKVLA